MANWSEFEKLPGSKRDNFEALCRSLIRLRYGRYGTLAALANQPGVEFHLRLDSDCDLGARGKWFGWQCRWFDKLRDGSLGSARRKKIEEALRTTQKHLPDLTDWVLWTRQPLTKGDQKWFDGLTSPFKRHLWTEADVETLLSGDAEILRQTYFGELIFTPNSLLHQHELSVAPIRKRWLPEAHQTVDAERTLRRMLAESASWGELLTVSERLESAMRAINREPNAFADRFSEKTPLFVSAVQNVVTELAEVHRLLDIGDFDLLRQRLTIRTQELSQDVVAVPRKLRGAKLACGLTATNALADLKLALRLLGDVDKVFGTRLVSVIADAGGGKTQLAAQLTAALPDRPAGILLHGRELHSGRSMDDLATAITANGQSVPSMEALLAGLDAAGQRARRRLPLVIDGLNEAEDPRQWKAALATLDASLKRYANVLLVCTVRTGARRPGNQHWARIHVDEIPARADFAMQALPDDTLQIEIPDFGGDAIPAMKRYFAFFRINVGDADPPIEMRSHPLTLRLFCEVTNPKRDKDVGVEAMPGSLTALFEQYIDHAVVRIADLAPKTQRYFEQDIRRVLDLVGTTLWETNTRELPEDDLRKSVGDDARRWNESIIHMLEQEGVILRIPGEVPGRQSVIPIYDALGGHLIAESILTKLGRDSLQSWVNDPATLDALNSGTEKCHPLARDIFRALVGLVPRMLHRQQLWQILDEPLKSIALTMTARLEGKYLDATTISSLGDCIRNGASGYQTLFRRLFHFRASPEHPLNAAFLDRVLRTMSVANRDICWTEWVRENRDRIQANLRQMEDRWRNNLSMRTPADRLRAKWSMWVLTSTVRWLRDLATRALYWFGRGDPPALFALTEESADINDPYVFERTLVAAYGVAMAASSDLTNPAFTKTALRDHALKVFDLLFKHEAPCRTTHVLTRDYGRQIVELACVHNPSLLTPDERKLIRPPYKSGGRIVWREIDTEEDEYHGAKSPFRMDFENYTLGRLVRSRGNYDYKHDGYRKVRGRVLWRVQELGWNAAQFERIDGAIESDQFHYGRQRADNRRTDRYGKKYSWIAYFELKGCLQDEGKLDVDDDGGRSWEVDIDPSFPSPVFQARVVEVDLLGNPEWTVDYWIGKGPTPDLEPYLTQETIGGLIGPWVMLDGYVSQGDKARGREVFAFVRSFLVDSKKAATFAKALEKQSLGGRWLPEKSSMSHTFAGETPWCRTVSKNDPAKLRFVVKERVVKVKKKNTVYLLDGRPITLPELIEIIRAGKKGELAEEEILNSDLLARVDRREEVVEEDEVQRDFKEYSAIIPVVDFTWEERDLEDRSVRGVTLAKQLAKSAQLVNIPQTLDFQTKDGTRATFGTAFAPDHFRNCERFFFIRERVLQPLLQKLKLSLVWAVWGERELSHEQIEAMRKRSSDDPMYANFQTIYRYSGKQRGSERRARPPLA